MMLDGTKGGGVVAACASAGAIAGLGSNTASPIMLNRVNFLIVPLSLSIQQRSDLMRSFRDGLSPRLTRDLRARRGEGGKCLAIEPIGCLVPRLLMGDGEWPRELALGALPLML